MHNYYYYYELLVGPTNIKTTNQNNSQISHTIYHTTNNARNPDVYNMIRSNLPILQNDAKVKRILDNHEIIKSNRQPKN